MSSIVPINISSLIQSSSYNTIDKNDNLEIIYKGNGIDYVIESYTGDEMYTLSTEFVDSLAEKLGYDQSIILDFMYVLYRGNRNLKACDKNPNATYLKIDQASIEKNVSYLLSKYGMEEVLSVLENLRDYELVKLSNGENCDEIIRKIEHELSNDSYSDYDDETRDYDYDGVVIPSELVEYGFCEPVQLRK